ncbi:two-component sensor histidine kinase [Pseudorhodoferax aquiterrae]|uniref:histidine kinase n=1 Tax=Pseudorhodoferax aquiterrae TaxID=747304 RepID=A0ABQ3G860_9BURK|nr:histidine kinase dimerization/phospho-acceptor domain-containing protein [Pseudorhodoferax aquiterrae]GHC96340.1 two-component sensor histidine kinase [Pseudorhodoferax aquiterrae]
MTRRPSLQRQLLAWTLGALVAVWSVFMLVGYHTGVEESDELTDGHLASVASLLLAQSGTAFEDQRPDAASLGVDPNLKAHDYQQSLSVAIWDENGRLLTRTGPAPLVDFTTPEGFATLQLGQPVRAWRVFVRSDALGQARKVAVLLSVQERDDLAEDIAEQVATPGLWLLPIVTLVLTLAVRRGLQPLLDLSARVRAMDIHQASRLHAPPHAEFQAMVEAIETLGARYQTALVHERELADTFAHELRTPLASLRLHAASLRGTLTPAQRQAALAQIEADAARTAAIMDDLLALARAGRAQLAEAAQPLDLAALARRIAAEQAQDAFDAAHELAVDAPAECLANGHPVLLEIALRNLVVNALGHTPPGTAVEIRVQAEPPALQVRDNAAALLHAGAPRRAGTVLGLGLGHQVVQRVAAVHGGHFRTTGPDADGWRCDTLTLGQAPGHHLPAP